MSLNNKRLESLDVLRGFDLFCLTILCPVLHAFNQTGPYPWLTPLMRQFNHVSWSGFAFWDLIMPLFMFMAGVSIPFAFSKYLASGESKMRIYKRIGKRVVLLWVLGMICQGNLLALQISALKIYSNTLQAIAIGYLFSALLFLHSSIRTQIVISASLLLLYWAALTFISVDGYGKGDFTASGNLSEWVDRAVLGKWRDGAILNEHHQVVFSAWYDYTWILSSLNFVVTVMTGVFAGQILKAPLTEKKKLLYLFSLGVGMALVGWLWHFQFPVIKRIWTSSMVLVSSGYCFLLMGLFYYLIDYKGFRRGWTWLKVIGMNSILAYLLSVEVGVFHFDCIGQSLLFGFQPYLSPEYYRLLLLTAELGMIYLLLYFLYKHRIFLKV